MDQQLFDDLLNLEDTYYQDGYRLGVEDGSRAGRIEGRTFGLEKGFEKFFDMGKLHGKSQIWDARLPTNRTAKAEGDEAAGLVVNLLPNNDRLAKHVRMLGALTELKSLSTENNEDTVSDFDDRLKRATAKVKVIENIIGERNVDQVSSGSQHGGITSSSGKRPGVMLSRNATSDGKNIEDFGVPTR